MFRRQKPVHTQSVCGVEGCEMAVTSVWRQGYTWEPECSGEAETIHLDVPIAMCDTHFALIKRIMMVQEGETTAPALQAYANGEVEKLIRLAVWSTMREMERRAG